MGVVSEPDVLLWNPATRHWEQRPNSTTTMGYANPESNSALLLRDGEVVGRIEGFHLPVGATIVATYPSENSTTIYTPDGRMKHIRWGTEVENRSTRAEVEQ